MRFEKAIWAFAAAASLFVAAAVTARHAEPRRIEAPPKRPVTSLKVTLLSTMLAEEGLGEWGFSALVEVDGHTILFDTGKFPDTVLKNAKTLGVDLDSIDEFVLSHHHGDHTGGLLTLRDAVKDEAPKALSRAHVGKGFFWPRRSGARERETNTMIAARAKYEASGGTFLEHDAPIELYPGVFLTGPVPRVHDEKNFGRGVRVEKPNGWTEDDLPEDQSLVFDTDRGLVVLSGCGHAGVINTLEYVQKVVRNAHVHAAIGGFHLYSATDSVVAWTADELRAMGLENFLGAHCTGLEATYRIRDLAGLSRATATVGAVGASFTLGKGINPLGLAR